MSTVIQFPSKKIQRMKSVEELIDNALDELNVKMKHRDRVKKVGLQCHTEHDDIVFKDISFALPSEANEEQISIIKQIFEDEIQIKTKLLLKLITHCIIIELKNIQLEAT